MPELKELNDKFDSVMRTFEDFKKVNDKELKDIKAGKYIPEDQKERLDKLNTGLDTQSKAIEDIKVAMNKQTPVDSKEAKAAEDKQSAKFASDYMRYGTPNKEVVESYFKNLEAKYGDSEDFQKELSIMRKSVSAGTNPDGGYFVRPEHSDKIRAKLFESSPMRQLADSITIGGNEYRELYDNDEPQASSVGEKGARSETTSNPIKEIAIPVHEMFSNPALTQNIIDDAAINVEEWHSRKVRERFARLEATWFISGNGVSEARGILNYTNGDGFDQIEQVDSGASAAFAADGLIDTQNALFEEFQSNAMWLMKRASAGLIRKLKDGQGQYLWSLDKGLNNEPLNMLLGRPVRFANDMETAAANSKSAAYGDFKQGYMIAEKQGIRVLRDPFTNKPFVHLYTTKRVGGGVVQFQAIKLNVLGA